MGISLRTIRRAFGVAFLMLAVTSFCSAQEAQITRNANLRPDPSTGGTPLRLLTPPEKVDLVESTKTNGYNHVRTKDGQEGWVWSRNLSVPSSSPSGPQVPSAALTTPGEVAQCDDSLWDHVYNPQRLIVKQKCLAVTGIIADATNGKKADGVRHEADGDTHGWLKLDPQFINLLNAGNMSNEGGNLVFEIVCKFRVTQADAFAACPSTYHSPVQIPPIGSHVRILGTYV